MKAFVAQLLRSRWLAAGTHVGLWLLLYLALLTLGGKLPPLHDADVSAAPTQSPVPVASLYDLFSADAWPRLAGNTNAVEPFFTRHFIPSPIPPPTTRKIEVTYQGFYQAGTGPKQALIKLGATFVVSPIGAAIATNLFVADATFQTLTLTNRAAQTNLLSLNAKKEIEVPIP
jgi:hypothetical protein